MSHSQSRNPAEHSYFHGRQKALAIACAVYMACLFLFHSQLPAQYVWISAAVLSVAMNFTYLIEARSRGRFANTEIAVALVLILMAVIGAVVEPLLVIASIFGHGLWDVAKHFGAGVPFLSWYTWGCAVVDTAYSAALLWYWF